MKIAILVLVIVLSGFNAYAQSDAVRQSSGQEAQRQMQERERKLRQRIEQPRAVGEYEAPSENGFGVGGPQGEKVLINTINVRGNTILSSDEIAFITRPYEGRMLTLKDMQKVADLLTSEYRGKGFVTSRVVLPPQEVTDHTLELNVIQGVMGDVQVAGNRYFKQELIAKRIQIKKGEVFDYDKLRNGLRIINEHPDRNVRAVLAPGKEQGQTDVLLNVKDQLPIHMGLSYDNFASKYIGKHRYTGTATHNNLLGFDDIMTLEYQMTNNDGYRLLSGRYLFPAANATQIGIYGAHDYLELQREFAVLEARGKSKLYSVFVNQTLRDEESLKIMGNAGFDYKDVYNFQLGSETSRDRLRIVKLGMNVDGADNYNGRNIVNNDIFFGLPNAMGGLDDVDTRSSRVGSGGKFVKDVLDVLRLQGMPGNTSLLLKGQVQFASTILPAIEQYQLGGISNIRGFAPGEAVGDSGQTFTAEYSVPIFFLPRDKQIPFSKAYWSDALRLAAFYDWGHVKLRNPQAGEPEERTLGSLGTGIRMNLPEELSLRADVAWAVQGRSSDGGSQLWLQATKVF